MFSIDGMRRALAPMLRNYGAGHKAGLQARLPHQPDAVARDVFPHLAPDFAQVLLRQVRDEGYHVETLHTFLNSDMTSAQAIALIQCWAAGLKLKVSFNPAHGICFFEMAAD